MPACPSRALMLSVAGDRRGRRRRSRQARRRRAAAARPTTCAGGDPAALRRHPGDAGAGDAGARPSTQYAPFLTGCGRCRTRGGGISRSAPAAQRAQRLTNRAGPTAATRPRSSERLTALQELEARCAAEIAKAYNGIDEVLSPLQQARFRVFEEQIERRKLELMATAPRSSRTARTRSVRRRGKPPGRWRCR